MKSKNWVQEKPFIQVIVDTSAADKANAQNKKLQGEMGKVQADLENTKKELVQAKRDLERFEAAKRQLQQQGPWLKINGIFLLKWRIEAKKSEMKNSRISPIFKGLGKILKHKKVKAEQEQNKKLQNQIREMEKKIQDLGDEHKKEISKIKKVCL